MMELAVTPPEEETPNPNPVSDSPLDTNNLNVDTTTNNDGGRSLFLITLGEKDREIERLKALAQQSQNPPVRQTAEEQWNQFTSAPKDMIREEVSAQFTNVNAFINEVQKERAINKLKDAFRNDPKYAPIFQFAEGHLDQFLSNSSVINSQTMQLALLTVSGAIATGQIQVPGLNLNLTPASTPPATAPRSNIIPPQTPRTTTQLPIAQADATVDTTPLTENERRLMRSCGMTEEEWRKGKAGDSLTVPTKKV